MLEHWVNADSAGCAANGTLSYLSACPLVGLLNKSDAALLMEFKNINQSWLVRNTSSSKKLCGGEMSYLMGKVWCCLIVSLYKALSLMLFGFFDCRIHQDGLQLREVFPPSNDEALPWGRWRHRWGVLDQRRRETREEEPADWPLQHRQCLDSVARPRWTGQEAATPGKWRKTSTISSYFQSSCFFLLFLFLLLLVLCRGSKWQPNAASSRSGPFQWTRFPSLSAVRWHAQPCATSRPDGKEQFLLFFTHQACGGREVKGNESLLWNPYCMARTSSQRLRVRAMLSTTETFQPLDLNWYSFSLCHATWEQSPNVSHGWHAPMWACTSSGSPSSLLSLDSYPVVHAKQLHFLFNLQFMMLNKLVFFCLNCLQMPGNFVPSVYYCICAFSI